VAVFRAASRRARPPAERALENRSGRRRPPAAGALRGARGLRARIDHRRPHGGPRFPVPRAPARVVRLLRQALRAARAGGGRPDAIGRLASRAARPTGAASPVRRPGLSASRRARHSARRAGPRGPGRVFDLLRLGIPGAGRRRLVGHGRHAFRRGAPHGPSPRAGAPPEPRWALVDARYRRLRVLPLLVGEGPAPLPREPRIPR
jgi:hypothetical protein